MLKNLYKDALGDNILFEEVNKDLNIAFRYQWLTSKEYGFIKELNLSTIDEEFNFKIIDGVQNILPSFDTNSTTLSNLSNAYKHSEIIKIQTWNLFTWIFNHGPARPG